MDTIQQDPNPAKREAIGLCEAITCSQDAYYMIDFGSDDIKAYLCSPHHTQVLKIMNDTILPEIWSCEDDE